MYPLKNLRVNKKYHPNVIRYFFPICKTTQAEVKELIQLRKHVEDKIDIGHTTMLCTLASMKNLKLAKSVIKSCLYDLHTGYNFGILESRLDFMRRNIGLPVSYSADHMQLRHAWLCALIDHKSNQYVEVKAIDRLITCEHITREKASKRGYVIEPWTGERREDFNPKQVPTRSRILKDVY